MTRPFITCAECGRERPHAAHGLCGACYLRKRNSPGWVPRTHAPVRERVLSRLIITPSGCLLWTGATDPAGYGHIYMNGHYVGVHRLMWNLFCGPIPPGHDIDHLCRVPPCAAPVHLEAVPHRINVLRGISPSAVGAAKTRCPQNHEYTHANTYVTRTGRRQCRACNKAKCAQYRLTGSTVGFADLLQTGQFAAVMADDGPEVAS